MFDTLDQNLVNELIIKQYLNLGELLNLRMVCKILHNYTDNKDKDNNEFLWKFYYLKNELHNYRILPNSKNIYSICSSNRSNFYEWYNKIYNKCHKYYINKIKRGENVNIDDIFKVNFKEKDVYLKELFQDCCIKLHNIKDEHLFCWKNTYEFWNEIGSPSIHLHHYDLSTCGFECNKKPINYKCFFKEIAKRHKTKYKKFLSLMYNNEIVCKNRIQDRKNRILQLQKELVEEEKNLNKIQDIKIKQNNIEEYLKTVIKTKKNK